MDGIDDCVRARSCREPVRKRHVEYDIYQHIPAGYEQRTTYADTMLQDVLQRKLKEKVDALLAL